MENGKRMGQRERQNPLQTTTILATHTERESTLPLITSLHQINERAFCSRVCALLQ